MKHLDCNCASQLLMRQHAARGVSDEPICWINSVGPQTVRARPFRAARHVARWRPELRASRDGRERRVFASIRVAALRCHTIRKCSHAH